MLTSIIFGNPMLLRNSWELFRDNYGNKFISFPIIKQKIRFAKDVDMDDIIYKTDTEELAEIELPEKSNIVVNNKNMNLTIMRNRKPDNNSSDNILYLTLLNYNYTLIRFKTDYQMIQTYRNKNQFQGCAIKYSEDITDTTLIQIQVRDNTNEKFYNIVCSLENSEFTYNVDEIEKFSKDQKTCYAIWKKTNEQGVKFKVQTSSVMTSTFITISDYFEKAQELSTNIKNANIIVIDDPSDENKLIEAFKDFKDDRIRAVTTVGVKVSIDVCRKSGILYLFDYDLTNGTIKCLKSN